MFGLLFVLLNRSLRESLDLMIICVDGVNGSWIVVVHFLIKSPNHAPYPAKFSLHLCKTPTVLILAQSTSTFIFARDFCDDFVVYKCLLWSFVHRWFSVHDGPLFTGGSLFTLKRNLKIFLDFVKHFLSVDVYMYVRRKQC